ncbi:MAG TPA: pentapeptide repeat-containing protein, partial [Rubrobacter sp.]|nr:pentapeptide repeat-containing protein [Rubrobacter sp.]
LITAGVAGAVGIFFTWRGQRLAREAQDHNQKNTQEQLRLTRRSQEQSQKSTQAQLENAQEELRLTRQGQITERFTRAIDQLGSEKLEIRLGGIYALERISSESAEDYWPVMEVLTAYVRKHAPLPCSKDWLRRTGQEGTEGAPIQTNSEEGSSGESEPFKVPASAPDLQAVIIVLRRRTRYFRHGEPESLDLHETNLSGARLSRANLSGANLSGAAFWGAILSGAILSGANLQLANLSRADLSGARLWEACLSDANFAEANLSGADLSGANLQLANLSRADLRGANVSRANLSGTRLSSADLSGADLSSVFLRGERLLKGNFSGALTQAQIDEARGDKRTKLPDHLKRPASWT